MNALAKRTARALQGAMLLPVLLLAVATPRTAHAQSTLANTSFSSTPVSGAVATDAMKQALRARGLTPPRESGLTLDDYVTTRIASGGNAENRHVSVMIGPEGHLLPSAAWRDAHPNYCKRQARHMRAPERMLDVKINRTTERAGGRTRHQLFTFARLIESGSRKIIEQREGQATNMTGVEREGEGGVPDAVEAALKKLQGPVAEAPDGPCGEVRLQHIGGRNAGDEFVFRAGFPGVHNPSLSYTWDFGDGSPPPPGAGKIARHVFGEAGIYEVSVTVEGENVEPGTQTIRVELGTDFHFTFSGHVNAESYGDTYPHFGWTDDAVWVGTFDNGTRWVAISFARSGVRRYHYFIVYLLGELGRGTYRTVRASGQNEWETDPLTAPSGGTKAAHVQLWARNLNSLTGVDEVFMEPIYRRHSPSNSDWYEYPLVSGTVEVNEWAGKGSADPHLEAVLDVTLEGRTRSDAPATLHISGEFRTDLRFRDE